METPELTNWLRANSSGCYAPSTEAADKIQDLERHLAACRTALESITHDMGASQAIHNLCAETLELTKP